MCRAGAVKRLGPVRAEAEQVRPVRRACLCVWQGSPQSRADGRSAGTLPPDLHLPGVFQLELFGNKFTGRARLPCL